MIRGWAKRIFDRLDVLAAPCIKINAENKMLVCLERTRLDRFLGLPTDRRWHPDIIDLYSDTCSELRRSFLLGLIPWLEYVCFSCCLFLFVRTHCQISSLLVEEGEFSSACPRVSSLNACWCLVHEVVCFDGQEVPTTRLF